MSDNHKKVNIYLKCANTTAILFVVVLATLLFYRQDFWHWLTSPETGWNEIGDLLAGTAGTFALIYIVAGYFLQSKDLSIQIDEIRSQTETFRHEVEVHKCAYDPLIAVEHNNDVHGQQQYTFTNKSQNEFWITKIHAFKHGNKEWISAPNLFKHETLPKFMSFKSQLIVSFRLLPENIDIDNDGWLKVDFWLFFNTPAGKRVLKLIYTESETGGFHYSPEIVETDPGYFS